MEGIKAKKRLSVSEVILHLIFLVCSSICIIPILLVVMISLSDETGIVNYGYRLIPHEWSTAAYQFVYENKDIILNAYGVTIFVTIAGTLISVLVITLYAYPISRRNFKYKNLFTFIIFFTMLFNGGLVPWYLVCTYILNLKNSIWALIVPMLFNAWYVMIVRTFFQTTIPDSLIESAKIDGATEMRIFFSIVLPLSKPVLATIGLFTTIAYWNDWWSCLMLISKEQLYNLQYTIYQVLTNIAFLRNASLSGNGNLASSISDMPNETARMAMAVLAIGPIVFAYPFFQKYFVKGLTIGAVKG